MTADDILRERREVAAELWLDWSNALYAQLKTADTGDGVEPFVRIHDQCSGPIAFKGQGEKGRRRRPRRKAS
jgi:hypothetical protein